VLRYVGWCMLFVLVVASGLAGGLYLWFHQSLAAMHAHSSGVKLAQKRLDVTAPGRTAVALLLGDNQRAGLERSAGGRSDTIMLVRADPKTKTISLLSIPRDLQVPVYCPRQTAPLGTTRIDYAFAYCGPAGSLETVQRLTGLPINYLVTVDFHGFKEIVNQMGGIWLDIDRRYYNKDVGTAATDYSSIDLQPGYQLLSGGSALEFVRFRHTDSDLYRLARDQEFIRALKDQLSQHFDPLKLPGIVSAITHNVEIGACSSCLSDTTVLRYALFAITLPHGHLLQNAITQVSGVNVNGADELQASPTTIRAAVYRFTHPEAALPAAAAPAPTIPARAIATPAVAQVRTDPAASRSLLDPVAARAGFALEVPTILEASSSPDMLPGDEPVRLYAIAPGRTAVRLVFHTAGNEFWGVEETDLSDPPALSDRNSTRRLGSREFQLYYAGAHLHMVVLRAGSASYWVVNTLLDSLSNQTMLAIAEGLQPLAAEG